MGMLLKDSSSLKAVSKKSDCFSSGLPFKGFVNKNNAILAANLGKNMPILFIKNPMVFCKMVFIRFPC